MYKPRFKITTELLSSLGQIEAAKGIIDNAPLVPLWEMRFKKEAVERSVHYATALEGNPLNFTEVKEILDKGSGHSVVARERDIQEVLNYRDAVGYLESVDKEFITADTIGDLNAIITKNILADDLRGKYREVAAVSRDSRTLEKILDWPEPGRVPGLMAEFCGWLKGEGREANPILRAGIIHTWFVLIHPFYEGNGRTARILSTLSLFLDGYDIKKFFSLEEYYDSDAESYYKAIKSVLDTKGDYTCWLEYFCLGLAMEFNRVKERVLKLSRDAGLREAAGQVRLNPRQEKIIIFVKDYGQIKNQDWGELFPAVSDDTILRDIKELVEKGILVKKGKTKAARYELK